MEYAQLSPAESSPSRAIRTMVSCAVLCAFLIPIHAALAQPVTLRIATFNIEDVRTTDLADGNQPRLKRLAEVIQRLRPNIILINELAYDMPGAPGYKEGEAPGQNGQRFADLYLAVAQAPDLRPLKFKAYMPPTNTGLPSGFDLDNDGHAVLTFPAPDPSGPDGSPGKSSEDGRKYGNDCWGFGTFPGQYGFALLVDDRLTIEADKARTFQRLPWAYMDGNYMPSTATGTPWYNEEEQKFVRLCSKTFADVPVKLPNGAEIHLLCHHPTPPAFDGPEERNKRRNHDEIRLIGDYIEGASYLVDDAERVGGLGRFDSFVVLGDLNADPVKGDSFKTPMVTHLLGRRRINNSVQPVSEIAVPGLEPSDTARFKLRVDYAIPSNDITLVRSGVWRMPPADGGAFPSDHFPVWIEVTLPEPAAR